MSILLSKRMTAFYFPITQVLDYEELLPEPPIIIVDDETPDTLDKFEETPMNEDDDSGEESDNWQDLFESGENPNDDVDDPDWLNNGSNDDDSLELEYDNMYGDLIDDDYED